MRLSSSAGRNGISITLVTQYDIHLVHSIEEQTRKLLSVRDWIRSWHSPFSVNFLACVFKKWKWPARSISSSFSVCEIVVQLCGVSAETKLKDYPVPEKDVLQILTQVNVTRRECEIVCMFISLYLVLFSVFEVFFLFGTVFYDAFVKKKKKKANQVLLFFLSAQWQNWCL